MQVWKPTYYLILSLYLPGCDSSTSAGVRQQKRGAGAGNNTCAQIHSINEVTEHFVVLENYTLHIRSCSVQRYATEASKRVSWSIVPKRPRAEWPPRARDGQYLYSGIDLIASCSIL